MLFYMIAGHALMDFSLQNDTMALEKNRHRDSPMQKSVPWYYWLTAHALIHGGTVGYITGSIHLGIAETIIHWIIDFGKCEKWYNIHVDQFLHIACKVVWYLIMTQT